VYIGSYEGLRLCDVVWCAPLDAALRFTLDGLPLGRRENETP